MDVDGFQAGEIGKRNGKRPVAAADRATDAAIATADKGAQAVDKLDAMPTPKALAARGERWGPYRSYASFYLWRIADAASAGKQAVKRSQD